MNGKALLLEGTAEADSSGASDYRKEVQRLEDEVRSLRRDIEDCQLGKARLVRTIENLRSILSPLHRGLRVLFGEIELAVGEAPDPNTPNGAVPAAPNQPADPRWQNFKASFPGRGAEIIDALMIHGEMRIQHLATLLHCDPRTVGQHAAKLRNAGAITQVQGVLSLKR